MLQATDDALVVYLAAIGSTGLLLGFVTQLNVRVEFLKVLLKSLGDDILALLAFFEALLCVHDSHNAVN